MSWEAEPRLKILNSLAEADGPLTFSTLRESVGTIYSGQFNYHLRKLDGLFVRKTDDGYSFAKRDDESLRRFSRGH